MFHWTRQQRVTERAKDVGVTPKIAIDWYNFCRDICKEHFLANPITIGGPGKIVEIDESLSPIHVQENANTTVDGRLMAIGCLAVSRGVHLKLSWWLSLIVPRSPYCPSSSSTSGRGQQLFQMSGEPTTTSGSSLVDTPTKRSTTVRTLSTPSQELTHNPSRDTGRARRG